MNPLDFSSSLAATPTSLSDGTFGSAQTALADFNSTITGTQAVPASNVPSPTSQTPAVSSNGWNTLNQTIGNLSSLAGNLVQAGQTLQQQGAALPASTGIVSSNTSGGVPTKTLLIAGAALVALVVVVAIAKRSS